MHTCKKDEAARKSGRQARRTLQAGNSISRQEGYHRQKIRQTGKNDDTDRKFDIQARMTTQTENTTYRQEGRRRQKIRHTGKKDDTGRKSHLHIFIHPGPRILDPKYNKNNKRQKRGRGLCCLTFFCRHKFQKVENYLLNRYIKNQQLIQRTVLFTPKILTKLSEIWVAKSALQCGGSQD